MLQKLICGDGLKAFENGKKIECNNNISLKET